MKTNTGELVADCFGVVRNRDLEPLKCDAHLIKQYDYCLNKEKGIFEVTELDPIDINEIIQSNKENCGLSLALLNIAKGVSPMKYADDGQHGGDFSGSTNINEVYQEKVHNDVVAQKLAQELGIDNYQDFTNVDDVIKFIEAKKKAQALLDAGAGQPVPVGGDK